MRIIRSLGKKASETGTNLVYYLLAMLIVLAIIIAILISLDIPNKVMSTTYPCSYQPDIGNRYVCAPETTCLNDIKGKRYTFGASSCKLEIKGDKTKANQNYMCCALPKDGCFDDKQCSAGEKCTANKCIKSTNGFAYEQGDDTKTQNIADSFLDANKYTPEKDQLYLDEAYNRYNIGDFDHALTIYDFLLGASSNLFTNAQANYYKGEISLAKKDNDGACIKFKSVLGIYTNNFAQEITKNVVDFKSSPSIPIKDYIWFKAYCSGYSIACDITDFGNKFDVPTSECFK